MKESAFFVGAGLVPARRAATEERRVPTDGAEDPPLVWGLSRGEKWTSELLLLSCFLAFFLSSLLPFWRVSSFTETFLHLDATFFLTLPRRQNLLVDSVLRRGQLVVEADRDIR